MKTISGVVRGIQSTGHAIPISGRKVYAIPSALSLFFRVGGVWQPVSQIGTGTPYGYGVECVTAADGKWQFTLPQAAESYSPQGSPVTWQVIDPTTGTVYEGAIADGLVDGVDLKTLLTSYSWVVKPILQVSGQDGPTRRGVERFENNAQEATITLVPPMPSADYVPMASGAMDDSDLATYAVYVKPGWTASQFTLRLNAPVPPPRTVDIPWTVQG